MIEIREHCCDFCISTDLVSTWNTRGERIDFYAVDATTGRAVQALHDKDGKWAACQDCHDGILDFKRAKVKPSAIRRFSAGVSKRTNWEKKIGPAAAKISRQQQKSLFTKLLPLLQDHEPFVPWLKPGQVVNLDQDMDEIFIPPAHISDGASRIKRR